jgi:hypothetical protein
MPFIVSERGLSVAWGRGRRRGRRARELQDVLDVLEPLGLPSFFYIIILVTQDPPWSLTKSTLQGCRD